MGRTNYSLNEMLNAVTKRAFNRYTTQTVDYQHLEAATTTSGLVSNRREYSSASILAKQFSLNAQNIVESNYDPFLKILLNDEIVEKTIPVLGQSNTDRMSYAISCTDDRKFMAVISKLDNEVKVYEFDETLDTQHVISASGTIDISGLDIDINRDGSETFVLKKSGNDLYIDKFDVDLVLISSTLLYSTYDSTFVLNVSEDGNRVFTHHGQISRIYDGLVTSSFYAPTISNNSLKAVMSRNGQIVVALYASPNRIETYEIPTTSPTSGTVTVQAVGSQNLGITNFDLSYDGKVMVTHTGSAALIYLWNGIEWKQFGQTITTGVIHSLAISEYADYFVVVGDGVIKVYKLNQILNVYEQYGNTISGTGQTVDISKNGDNVVLGNSTIDVSSGSAYLYSLFDGTTWVLTDKIDGSANNSVIDLVDKYNPYFRDDGISTLYNGGNWANNALFFQTNAPFIRITNHSNQNTNAGIWIPVTFGSKWSVTFKWHLDNENVETDGDTMEFIFFAPNQPTSTGPSQHGGYKVLHDFYDGQYDSAAAETHKIITPSGTNLTNHTVSYGTSGSGGNAFPPWGFSEYKTVTVSYDNGVLFTRVTNTPDSFLNNGYYTTFTGSDLEAQKALWGKQTYIAFAGRTGGYASYQYLKDFYVEYSNPDNLGKFVKMSNNGDKIVLGTDSHLSVKTRGLVNTPAGWLQRGNTISSTGTSLSLSNDGNNVVIGSPTSLGDMTIDGIQSTGSAKIYKFSGNLWSQHGQDLLGDSLTDFGKYVSITSNGSKVAIGSDKNSVVQVYNTTMTPTTITNATSSVVDTVSLTPQSSLLEMSGDGDRLFVNLSVWDKNNSVWTYRDGISEGSAADLSNNGSYLGVEYNNIARSYEIDSDGLMSKIGDDILPSDASSHVGAFRVNTANSAATINVNATNTEILNLASSYGTNVEICSLTWDPTIVSVSTTTQNDVPAPQSSEITGFASPSGFLNPYGNGIMLSRNGQVLVVYDTSKYSVYTVSGNVWTFVRSETLTSSYISSMSISDDGSRIAYSRNSGAACEILVQDTVNATYIGGVTSTSNLRSSTFKSNTILTVCRYNQDIEFYNYNGSQWILDSTKISPGYSSFLVSSACAKWSGDGTILAIGDATAGRVTFYEYGSGWTTHSFITFEWNTRENFGSVIDLSNDGNTVIVGAPGDGTSAYKGYVKVYYYETGINSWTLLSTITPSVDVVTTSGSVTTTVTQRNLGKSVTMSSSGNRIGYIVDEETQITTSTDTQGTIIISYDYDNRITNVYNGGSWGSVLYPYSYQIQITESGVNGANNGIWLPVTFGSSWSVSFEWYAPTSYGADDMRFIFYAPNQPSSYAGSQHGGYNVYHEFYSSDSHAIRTPTDSSLSTVSTSYDSNQWRLVTISYDNGVLTTTVGTSVNRSYTFTGSDLTAQQALWGTSTYIAISGRTGGVSGTQYIKNIDITWDSVVVSTNVTTKSQASIRDSGSGSLVNPAYLVDDTTPTELVNVSEDRELEAISMSYDGTRHGIRATTGSYDAIVKQLQPANFSTPVTNGWTKRGDIITFNTSSSGFGDTMSSSSDGNILAFGYVDSSVAKVRVYGFSDNSWSQLGSDILPSVSNANEISLDLSSDGATLIVLVDPVTGNSIGKAYTYSSTIWSQNGSTIEFRSTGVNKVKISGDGTTLAFGNNTPDSPFPFNIIRVYRKSQDWELISPTMTVAKSPSNYFGGGLSLTNDGSTLATFNNSGVEFSTFSTQTVSQTNYPQYLNDITISGATNDMGDLRLTDSGDRLFVMSGDKKVRVYDSTHTQETERGWNGLNTFSITKDGSSMVLTGNVGYTKVFNRDGTSWSRLGNTITPTQGGGGGFTCDIKNDGTSIVLVGSSDSLRLYKYDGSSWSLANSTSGQYGSSVFITDTNDIVLGNNLSNGSVKTFEIRDVFQDTSFSAPTLSLNGDVNNRLNFGAPYIELGATVTTSASNIPEIKVSGAVFKDEIGVYSIKYEAEDVLRKTADPIFRTVEVLPKLATIKLEGVSVIYHTQGTPLADPGVTASIPVTIYHTTPSDSTSFVPGFPNFVTATTVGEYEIYYTNDTPDKYLRLTTPAKRSVHVRARPVLSLVGASTVYNPLGQEYTDLGVNVTQSGESTTTMLQSLTVVATADGNKYSLNGVTQPTLYLQKGITFTGIQALIQQYGNHPLQISATPDGTHGGDNTIIAATESRLGGTLLIPTSPTSPKTLYYFCAIHPGMGGMIRIVSLNVNDPNVQLSQTQTVTYTTKDEFGIEAIPITRQVIVRKRPNITTSGTLYRIRNDPISIPSPTVDPTNLTSSLQSSNNINITQNGTYTITYNVRDGDGISSNLTRQSYNVGSYGNLVLLKTGYVSTLSKDSTTLAVYNTSVQIYKKGVDGSWNESGHITTDSTVTSMAFTSDGRHIIIGSSSYLTIGIVRVYKRNDSFQNGWEQLGLEIYGVDYLGYFGHGVAINDDATRIIVSAPEANTNSGTILKAGSLKIFELQENFWIQNTQVIEGLSPSELLGTSVSMSRDGDIIAIGSPGYARTTVSGFTLTTSNVGKTSVYRYSDNVWGLMGNAIEDGTIDKRNGYSISLSTDGNSIAVGSQSGGGVRVYNFRGGDWRPFGSQILGTFGKSVSLSGTTVVIGSEDVNNGRVHIYNLIDGDWSRVGRTFEKTIVAEGGTNDMGKNVNITSDGTLICVTSQNDIRIYSI